MLEISVSANIISALVYFDITLNCTVTQFLFFHACSLTYWFYECNVGFQHNLRLHMVFLRRYTLTFQISFSGLLSPIPSHNAFDEAIPCLRFLSLNTASFTTAGNLQKPRAGTELLRCFGGIEALLLDSLSPNFLFSLF